MNEVAMSSERPDTRIQKTATCLFWLSIDELLKAECMSFPVLSKCQIHVLLGTMLRLDALILARRYSPQIIYPTILQAHQAYATRWPPLPQQGRGALLASPPNQHVPPPDPTPLILANNILLTVPILQRALHPVSHGVGLPA